MIIRVKDLWLVRTAFERLLSSKDISISESCDPLWNAYVIYQEQRKQVWNRLGLDKEVPKWKMKWFGYWIMKKRKVLVEQFNDEVAKLAEEEVSFAPVPAEKFVGTVLDFLALKSKGIIGG